MKNKVRPRSQQPPTSHSQWKRDLNAFARRKFGPLYTQRADGRMRAAGQGSGGPEDRAQDNDTFFRRERGQ